MNTRFLWMEVKEAGGVLVYMFGLFIVLELTSSMSDVDKLVEGATKHRDLVRVSAVLFQALVSAMVFVPIVFMGTVHLGKGTRLPTLAVLPMSRLSLALNRYWAIAVPQAVLLVFIAGVAPLVSSALESPVFEGTMESMVARAFLSVAIVALYQLAADLFSGYTLVLSSSFALGLLLAMLGGAFDPGLFNNPVAIGAMACVLIAVESLVFMNRRSLV